MTRFAAANCGTAAEQHQTTITKEAIPWPVLARGWAFLISYPVNQNQNNYQLLPYAIGGVFLVIVIYSVGEYILIGMVSAGAIYLYKLANESNGRRH